MIAIRKKKRETTEIYVKLVKRKKTTWESILKGKNPPDCSECPVCLADFEAQDDVIPGGKIMMAYKKAMNLDEENDEYIVDFADFALECRRIPQAIKEYERYARRLELADIPIDDRLYMAARNLVDAIEVVDLTKSNPQVMPWLKSAIKWSVGGLGYSPEEASTLLLEE